jgi:S-adenosylmethionine decarboxylase
MMNTVSKPLSPPPFSLPPVGGLQIMADLYGCALDHLSDVAWLRDQCTQLVQRVGLTVVGERFYAFEPCGVTGVLLLAESHLALHTWPEHGFVSVDLYVCNLNCDNSRKAQQVIDDLVALLACQQPQIQRVERGSPLRADLVEALRDQQYPILA